MIKLPKFKTQPELFKHLADNVDDILYEKKCIFKKADGLNLSFIELKDVDKTIQKSDDVEKDEIKVRAIINTTMVKDSHGDVHINGLWKKSLRENKRIKHLQEHKMSFDSIISDGDNLKAYTKTYSWRDLGVDKDGETQALVFDSVVKRKRNPYMFEQYKDGNVDNHSVGMSYVTMKLAMDSKDEDHAEYKAEFDKHIDDILNKAEVKKDGFFYAIYEAKAREGSAVPFGSNSITPTQSVKSEDNTTPPTSIEDKWTKAIEKWNNKNR